MTPPSPRGVAVLFTVTAFVGAALLFTIQPLVARLLLPAYGGSATVWSTCSLFFQALLLVGYLYSHLATSRLRPARQPWVHLVVLALPVLALPLALPTDAVPGADQSPALWLLRTLALMIGLPFVVLSTSGPLLQRWYSWTDGPRREDPYFLFAASNIGSFGGLLAYPFLIEPHLTLVQQTRGFTIGFAVFALLTAACGLIGVRTAPTLPATSAPAAGSTRPSTRQLAVWCGYAFVPSCLMLAVTRHLSTDVAPIPLLWIAPLAIYLATFVVAFAGTSRRAPQVSARAAAGVGLAAAVLAPVASGLPLALSLTLNLGLVALAGYGAHRLLAASRPSPEHLTVYYLVIAVGGAIGGLVNGLLAPLVFDRVLEYPLSLVSLMAVCIALGRSTVPAARPVIICFAGLGIALGLAAALGVDATLLALTGVTALALLGYLVTRFAAAATLGLLVSVLALTVLSGSDVAMRERTFYGSYEVRAAGDATSLSHGTTLHGLQLHTDVDRHEPTTYYARVGPLGDLMSALEPTRVTAVGLGVGTIAAYGRESDSYTFVEIDPAVARIAEDTSFFTYLADSGADIEVEIGDGRLLVDAMPAASADLLVLDAFSSDAIPVHLLTREAFESYAGKVVDGGAIAVHVSNRSLDLAPVVADAADHLGWSTAIGVGEAGDLATPSGWVLLSPDPAVVDEVLAGERWSSLDDVERVAWTDDYSSVLSVLR